MLIGFAGTESSLAEQFVQTVKISEAGYDKSHHVALLVIRPPFSGYAGRVLPTKVSFTPVELCKLDCDRPINASDAVVLELYII